MRVEIGPASKVEMELLARGDENTLAIKPLFYGNGLEAATVGVLKVTNERGDVIYTGMLKVSGKGKPSLHDRTKTVVASADKSVAALVASKK